MKRATIEALFTDIKGCPEITGVGKGSGAGPAIKAAIAQMLKAQPIKHKRWTGFKATITVVEIPNGGGLDPAKKEDVA